MAKCPDGKYEIQIHLLAEPGYCLPLATPSISSESPDTREWGKAIYNRILADDLESAESAAHHFMAIALVKYEERISHK